MPPNQDTSNDNSNLPTLSENTSQPIGAIAPEQITSIEAPIPPPTSNTPITASPTPQVPPQPLPIAQPPVETVKQQPVVSQNNPSSSSPPPIVVSAKVSQSHMLRNLFLFLIFFLITASALSLTLAYNNYPFYKPPMAIQKTLDSIIIAAPIPKPTRIILETTVAKSLELKSANQKTEFSFSTNAKNFPVSSVKLGLSGPIEFKSQEKQAAEADINLEVKFEGATFNGSASVKQINDTIYFKANEIPFGQFYQQLLDYKNKWYFYKIPETYLPKENAADTTSKVLKVLTGFVDKSQNWTKVTSQDGNVYTLEVTPPKKELDNLMFDLIAAAEPKDQKQLLTDVEKEKFAAQTEKIKNLKITAKVNKDSYYLKSANVSFDINQDNLALPTGAQTTLPVNEPIVFNVNISTELSDYNKQVVIIPPEGAQDFQKIIDEYSKQHTNQSEDSKIKNDIGAIATEIQMYYTANPESESYPKDLSQITSQDYLKTLPTPPLESGVDSYQYLKNPSTCEGTKANPCKEIALYAPLVAPKTPGNVWCYQTTTGRTQELAKSECTAVKSPDQPSTQTGVRDLMTPDQIVLGEKTNWEMQTLHLFMQLFK